MQLGRAFLIFANPYNHSVLQGLPCIFFRSEWLIKFNSHFFGYQGPCKLFKYKSHRTINSDIQEMFVVFWCNTSSSGNNCDVIFTGEEDSTNRTKARSLTPEHVLVKRLQIVSRQLRKAFLRGDIASVPGLLIYNIYIYIMTRATLNAEISSAA